MTHVMKLHPWQEVVDNAQRLIRQGCDVHQQFNCEKCGQKLTMDTPNTFYMSGTCDKCGHETDIKKNGHNFLVHAKNPQASEALLKEFSKRP